MIKKDSKKVDLITLKKDSNKCYVGDYLDGFKTESIKKDLNNLIYQEIKYKDFKEECRSINIKNKIKNIITIPTSHLIEKHYDNCLINFIPDIKETSNKSNKTDEKDIIIEKTNLVYTDYSNYKPEEIPVILRTKMMDVACKLTDIALYRLEEYKNSIRSSNENIKETLVSFKLIMDLFNIETNNYSDSEIKDKSIEELLESKIIVDLHLESLGDEKR